MLLFCHKNVVLYLHDNELQGKWQLSDVTGRQVKQEGGVPDGVASAGAFCFLCADYFPFLTQVDDNVMVCEGRNHLHSQDFVLWGAMWVLLPLRGEAAAAAKQN